MSVLLFFKWAVYKDQFLYLKVKQIILRNVLLYKKYEIATIGLYFWEIPYISMGNNFGTSL